MNKYTKNLKPAILVATLLHGFFILFLSLLSFVPKFNLRPKSNVLKIQTITHQEFEKLRTIGIKGGDKDTVLIEKKRKKKKSVIPKKEKNLSLRDLGTGMKMAKGKQGNDKNEASFNLAKVSKNHFVKANNLSTVTKSILGIATHNQQNPQQSKFFDNSSVDLRFDLPEGVEKSELNKVELKFFSFKKRLAESYITSIYKEFTDFTMANPHLKFPPKNKHHVTGRITYDQDGNIKSIKMVKWSKNDDVQVFFEKVLRNMTKLPNPPKEFVSNEKEFSVYYGLIIDNS